MKKTILMLSVVLAFPMALLADGPPDGAQGAPGAPGGPHHKHHGQGDGPAGQGQDDPAGPAKKGGCKKGKGGPDKTDKPDENK
jgi:hypothetical protein